jgi:regulator of sigma E protease
MNILLFFIILLILVLVHEFGHFFAAKKFNIRVDEFGFGFPPKLFGVKKGETEYTFNILPIGGFVKIYGENPEVEEGEILEKERNFSFRPAWQQAIVLIAGVVMNFLLAFVLFSISFMSGLPTSVGSEPSGAILSDVHTVILSVVPGSPAERAGIKIGDVVTQISLPISLNSADYIDNPSPSQIQNLIYSQKSSTGVGVKYKRINQEFSEIIKPEIVNNKSKIGISMDQVGTAKLSIFPALWQGMKLSILVFKNTVTGLFNLIWDGVRGRGSLEAVTGPVGMVGIVGDAYRFGFIYLVSFMAFISINLSVINLLPFPALDGGRLFFLLIEKIKGSKITPKIVNSLNITGFVILILLMVLITYHDVVKLLQ